MSLPALVRDGAATLPQTYQRARAALVECQEVDECKDWADRAQALASYAKQAEDDELYQIARRIQGRAVRRVGELLAEFQGAGARTDIQPRDGTDPRSARPIQTQRQAAERAGLSERQEKAARRVAALPSEVFEEAIESERVPSVTKLAEMGRNAQPKPAGFAAATQYRGSVRHLAEFCNANAPDHVAGGLFPDEVTEVRALLRRIDEWNSVLLSSLPE